MFKNMRMGIAGGVIGIIALILLKGAFYQIDQSEYGLVTRFGEVKNVREQPGLYVKMPIMDSVQRIDRRTQRADIPPREAPDRDKERLRIDTVIRYRISDPLAFRKTLRNEATARERLQTMMYSAMRDTIALHDRTEIIGARPIIDEDGNQKTDDEGIPVYESLVNTRDEISEAMHRRIAETVESQGYGIEIIRSSIKRADFPGQVKHSIINRLQTERQRVAARHRADGEEEYRKHTAAIQTEADILLAEAERTAREIRGEGDARAIAIVEEALRQDPGFYQFLRTLESYEKTIRPGTTVIMSDEAAAYLRALGHGQENVAR